MIDELWTYAVKFYEGIKFWIAGAIGASIVAYYLRDHIKTKTEFVIFVLSGGFIAQYLTQLTVFIIGRFGWEIDPSNFGAVGFMLGTFGGLIIQQAVSYIVSGAWKEISFRKYLIEAIKEVWNNKGKK